MNEDSKQKEIEQLIRDMFQYIAFLNYVRPYESFNEMTKAIQKTNSLYARMEKLGVNEYANATKPLPR